MNLIFLLTLLMQLSYSATRDVNGNIIADEATRNDALFDSTVNPDPAEQEPAYNQRDAFSLQSNLMYGCVDTSLNGRSDGVCQANPKAPECVGLSASLTNATNCLEYFDPANPALGCKVYGTPEHPMEDWIAFGTNYYNTLSQCSDTKSVNDSTRGGLKSLTEMMVFDPNAPVGTGPGTLFGAEKSGWNSNISVGKLSDSDGLSGKLGELNDGASRLGYQTGDLIKSAQKKQSFLEVVSSSPFADKLNITQRSKIESGITDASMIVERIKSVSKLASADSETETNNDSSITLTAPSDSASQVSRSEILQQGSGEKIKTPAAPEKLSAEPARKQTLAERIAEIERLAREKRLNRRTASSEEQKSTMEAPSAREPVEEKTIFQRVSLAYKKHHHRLKSVDNGKIGNAILDLEKPEIFKDL